MSGISIERLEKLLNKLFDSVNEKRGKSSAEKQKAIQKLAFRLILAALIIWISAIGTVCPHCTKGEICWPDSFFQSILNKSSCLNYLLPEER